MTPAQSRAARGLVKWNQDDLARRARVSVVTIRNFENEKSSPQRATIDVMRRAFEDEGIVFIEANGGGPGVRLKSPAPPPAEEPAPAPKPRKRKTTPEEPPTS